MGKDGGVVAVLRLSWNVGIDRVQYLQSNESQWRVW